MPHDDDLTPTTALERLREIHADLDARIDALGRLLASPAPGENDYTSARWLLTRASRERWALLAHEIFPLLRHRGQWTEDVQALFVDGVTQQEATIAHVGRWPLRAAISDWDEYRRASAEIRATMRERIEREAHILYPLLTAMD